MSEPLTREQAGCPSCAAYAATWLGGCENPIHAVQANAYIRTLEKDNAALREQLAAATQERDAARKTPTADLQKIITHQLELCQQQLAARDAELERTMSRMASEYEMDMNEQVRKVRERDARIAELEKGKL